MTEAKSLLLPYMLATAAHICSETKSGRQRNAYSIAKFSRIVRCRIYEDSTPVDLWP